MPQLKTGFPEDDEIVLCTVTKINPHSVFVKLDEYDKGAMIHISEVSPGRIRNIRDFVKEGKRVVCKVLKVVEEKGYIDLSLRRVNEMQKRNKIDETKQEQKAEKIVEFAAKQINIQQKEIFDYIDKAKEPSISLYSFFENVVSDNSLLEKGGIPKNIAGPLLEAITQRVKEAEVEVKGKLKLTTYAPDGIETIRECLKKAQDVNKKASIKYLGAGSFSIVVKSGDYKDAEKTISKMAETAIELIKKHGGEGEFSKLGAA